MTALAILAPLALFAAKFGGIAAGLFAVRYGFERLSRKLLG